MERTPEQIKSRIALLQSRSKDNGNIVNKLLRELKRMESKPIG